jgi:hypothetical protein
MLDIVHCLRYRVAQKKLLFSKTMTKLNGSVDFNETKNIFHFGMIKIGILFITCSHYLSESMLNRTPFFYYSSNRILDWSLADRMLPCDTKAHKFSDTCCNRPKSRD